MGARWPHRIGWLLFASACSFAPRALDSKDAPGPGDGGIDTPRPIDAAGSADDPLALWDFNDGSGSNVADTGRAPAIDLTISDISHVTWGSGSLDITDDVRIESAAAATKIIDAARAANAITIEAWLTPAGDNQVGPARVVGVSFDAINRNFSVMQDGNRWAFRLRTSGTADTNGQPDLDSGATIQVVPQRQYVVATEEGSDRVLYVDGVEAGRDHLGGSFSTWNETYTAIIANDHTGTDRPWHGTLERIAIYDRVFSAAEVMARKNAGP
jgi:hypothetical protein